jgi:hypothetical protein
MNTERGALSSSASTIRLDRVFLTTAMGAIRQRQSILTLHNGTLQRMGGRNPQIAEAIHNTILMIVDMKISWQPNRASSTSRYAPSKLGLGIS